MTNSKNNTPPNQDNDQEQREIYDSVNDGHIDYGENGRGFEVVNTLPPPPPLPTRNDRNGNDKS